MYRKLFLFIFAASISAFAFAQDTITVMQYNLLEYGNYNSGWASCFETNNNTQQKDVDIRIVLDYVNPDIFTVNEFGATQALQDDFLRHNLNINGINCWKSDNIINYASSNIINHIFYNSNKFGLRKHIALRTNPRDTDIYELYCKSASLAAGDTIKLICVVAHLKAGMNYESSRRAQLQTAMDYIYQHYPNDNTLIMGDFNMYSSSESGYQLLTRNYGHSEICFVDPVGSSGVGSWNENENYAQYHTQATASWIDNDCRSTGGMDDRFDFILMADEIAFGYHNIRYVRDSYKAVGNDGRHFNQSINQGTNNSAPQAVIDAVFDCSDHLPVTMKLAVTAKLDIDENVLMPEYDASIAPNPASDAVSICFFNRFNGMVDFSIYDIQGQLVERQSASFSRGNQLHQMDISHLAKGFYVMQISNESHQTETLKLVVK